MNASERERLFNKDVPFITYIIHDKNMENGRTVTVYKPTQEYYILFELIKFRRLPATFPDIGITVISEGLEPSPSDVSTTQNVSTDIKIPSSIENTNPDYYKQELARRDALIERLVEVGNDIVEEAQVQEPDVQELRDNWRVLIAEWKASKDGGGE